MNFITSGELSINIIKNVACSCDQYRKYRKLIPNVDNWWWLLTPWTIDNPNSNKVRTVHPSGVLNSDQAVAQNRGVRPLICLQSDCGVEIECEDTADDWDDIDGLDKHEEAVLDLLGTFDYSTTGMTRSEKAEVVADFIVALLDGNPDYMQSMPETDNGPF